MDDRHKTLRQRLVDAVLSSPGASDSSVRRGVEARAAALGGRSVTSAGTVPQPLVSYVDKIATRAYTVTDEEVTALRQASYSEDAIFEVTISAALGAAMARLERGMAALKGDE